MKKVYNLIGLAQRAGYTSSGAVAVGTSLNRKTACILLMSTDIADNTKDGLIKSCRKSNVPWLMIGNKFELGASIGKAPRAALTINDTGMARAIIEAIQTAGNQAKSVEVVEWPK